MVGSINKVILVGNVGKDPEIRTTQDGREIASIVLATSDSWKDKATGERKEKTEWHRIVIFTEGLVNVVKNYVKKGSKLYIEGSLQTRKWQDNSGVERYTTEIALQGFNSNLTMLDNRSSSSSHHDDYASYDNDMAKNNNQNNNKREFMVNELEDEIPF